MTAQNPPATNHQALLLYNVPGELNLCNLALERAHVIKVLDSAQLSFHMELLGINWVRCTDYQIGLHVILIQLARTMVYC